MNKRLYVQVTKSGFAEKTAGAISKCLPEASIYALCASSMGLGIEYKRCEKEFEMLKICMKKGSR